MAVRINPNDDENLQKEIESGFSRMLIFSLSFTIVMIHYDNHLLVGN